MSKLFKRLLALPKNQHFFLFGARNTGKSTLIENRFDHNHTLFIDLLDQETLLHFSHETAALYQIVTSLPDNITHVVVDEIQKLPKLLDTVQRLMKDTNKKFILTGSSARKLKKGGANLLAGRAFVFNLFPLTFLELQDSFNLDLALRFGTLPQIFQYDADQERQHFLRAYAHTYLKEEIWEEHFIRQLDPFRRFLEVAAQCNGKIINFSNIARDVGVDDKTIQSYFSILEDTLIGFYLEPHHNSFRKRLSHKPKFYFFDTGIVRALTDMTAVPLRPQTSAYGDAFEHYIILECKRLTDYFNLDYRFSFLQTGSEVEIDLVVERPAQPLLCVEIKSSNNVTEKDLTQFLRLTQDIEGCEAICLSQDRYPKQIKHVTVLPWQKGIKQYFTK